MRRRQRILLHEGVDFLFDQIAFPWRLRQQIERPAQRACRGFMPGADEGDDIVFDLGARQPVRPFRAQEQCQEIVGNGVAIPVHARLAQDDRLGNDLAEEGQRPAATDLGEARQPARRTEEVQRIDPPHCLEQAVDFMGEFVGFTGNFAGKQGFRQDIIGEHRHVAGHIDGACNAFIALGKAFRGPLHRCGKTVDVAGVKTGAMALRERFQVSPSAVSSPSRRIGRRMRWRTAAIL